MFRLDVGLAIQKEKYEIIMKLKKKVLKKGIGQKGRHDFLYLPS